MALLLLWKKKSLLMRRFPPPPITHSRAGCSSSLYGGDVKGVFEAWAAEHGKSYKTPEEKEKRFGIFRDKLKCIQDHNSSHPSCCKKELTKFSDRTWDELHSYYCHAVNPRK